MCLSFPSERKGKGRGKLGSECDFRIRIKVNEHKWTLWKTNDRYLVLVVGPLANLSDDFMVLSEFLGLARALKAINSWYNSPKHALAMNRHILLSHFGHLASLVWEKLILGRFRDAVLPDFSRFSAGSDDYLNAFFTDLRHGRYCGRYVPGA